MSGWNEDNFLDDFMPLLHQKSGRGPCPDTETLCAALDGRASGPVRSVVDAHTATCPECSRLAGRLRSFAAPALSQPDPGEWQDTEKRLDRWMRSFLNSDAAAFAATPVPPDRIPWWRSFRLRWVMVPAMVCLAAAGVLFLARPPRVPPAQTASGAAPAGSVVPPIPQELKPSPAVIDLSAVKPAAPVDSLIAPPQPSRPVASDSVPPAAPPEARVTAQAESPQSASPQAEPRVPPAPPSAPVSAAAARTAAFSPQADPSDTPPPPPASVRIDAGTRVWILLKSTNPQNNGGFEFRGVVLLPVTHAGGVVLDQQAEVFGIGRVDQGRTSVRIMEFVWRGARYRLRGPSGATAKESGAGPVVEFNAGQVLETWLASVSTYEKVPGDAARPQG